MEPKHEILQENSAVSQMISNTPRAIIAVRAWSDLQRMESKSVRAAFELAASLWLAEQGGHDCGAVVQIIIGIERVTWPKAANSKTEKLRRYGLPDKLAGITSPTLLVLSHGACHGHKAHRTAS